MLARDRWYVIADAAEIPLKKPVKLRRFSRDLALWRGGDGQVRCIADRCPHRGASLSAGKVRGGCIACPFHAFEFDGEGVCTHIPAHGEKGTIPKAMRADAEIVREEKGWVWLWNGEPRERYPEVPWFEVIDQTYVHHTFQDEWPVHVTRAVENQLDMFHLPFVHKGTIGNFARPEADPVVERDGERMRIWDRKHEGMEAPENFYLEFHFPNIWINNLGPGFFIFAAFVAVDDGHAITYLRSYQNRLRLPVVGKILCWLTSQLNKVILGQDRRVVVTQRPIQSKLRMDEVLIPADRPIIEYRRMLEAAAEQVHEPTPTS